MPTDRRQSQSYHPQDQRRESQPRRAHERHDVSIEATLCGGYESLECNVHNLSGGGLKLVISQMLEQDEQVQVRLGKNRTVKARVAWALTPFYGLHFDEQGNEWTATRKKIEAYVAGDDILEDGEEYEDDEEDDEEIWDEVQADETEALEPEPEQ